jgi:hypothetical protein
MMNMMDPNAMKQWQEFWAKAMTMKPGDPAAFQEMQALWAKTMQLPEGQANPMAQFQDAWNQGMTSWMDLQKQMMKMWGMK